MNGVRDDGLVMLTPRIISMFGTFNDTKGCVMTSDSNSTSLVESEQTWVNLGNLVSLSQKNKTESKPTVSDVVGVSNGVMSDGVPTCDWMSETLQVLSQKKKKKIKTHG